MKVDGIRIRELQAGDSIEALTALLHRAYARLQAMGLNYTAATQSTDVTRRRIAGGTCFVAVRGEDIVGTVLAHPTYERSDCAYFTRPGVGCIHQFAIEPHLQGGGLGRALLERAERWLTESGFAEVAMDTAEPATHLIDFYRRLGYQAVDFVQWPGKCYRSVVLSKRLYTADKAA